MIARGKMDRRSNYFGLLAIACAWPSTSPSPLPGRMSRSMTLFSATFMVAVVFGLGMGEEGIRKLCGLWIRKRDWRWDGLVKLIEGMLLCKLG